jgi:hypothetical protein
MSDSPVVQKFMQTTDIEGLVEDIRTGKTILYCGKHKYSAVRRNKAGHLVPTPPTTSGCPECWRCYFYSDYCMTPANMRKERTDELETVIHHAVEYEKTGSFGKDFELYDTHDPRFQVEYERDAIPDKEEKS